MKQLSKLGRPAGASEAPLEGAADKAAQQLRRRLKTLAHWSERGQAIDRTFEFEGFTDSIHFVHRIAERAERAQHHPDIDIRFNKVTVRLTTHDEGAVTEQDVFLARQIDREYAEGLAP